MKNIIKVDIPTGQVLENNLQEFWDRLTQSAGTQETSCRNRPGPRQHSSSLQCQSSGKLYDKTLQEQIKKFNAQRKRQNINAWSEAELYQLAVLVGRQKKSYKQAARRMARSPGACHLMYLKLKDAGVV